MKKKRLLYIVLLASIFVILIIWFDLWAKDELRNRLDHPTSGEWITRSVEQMTTQAEKTPASVLPENVVIDPESGQYVLYNELTILASGENIEAIVAKFKGKIVLHIKETDTYQVSFPVKDLGELKQVREALKSKGLTVYYSVVIIP
jgi:hypothetical protein